MANNTVMILHTVPTLVEIKTIWICLFSLQYVFFLYYYLYTKNGAIEEVCIQLSVF